MRRPSPLALAAAAAAALACATPPRADPYLFAWPFVDAPLPPRGGTTRGAPVTLEIEPSQAWKQLRESGPAPIARDRAAILALAGDYRASFDFLETVLFQPGAAPARPYRSWGTERIYVVEERDDFVQLQHVLVMFVEDEDGAVKGPFVQKHWRQDWQYEPERALAYLGERRFALRPVPPEDAAGAWSQTVYQVDDSPRYGAIGRWQHGAEASTWQSGDAWRPLPRREHSVRDDYDVLAGSHRLTVLPTGWVHEQDNLKLALGAQGERAVAREAGVSRYERLHGFDFSAADAYWSTTAPFWAQVRAAWARRMAAGRFAIAARCGDEPGFASFFRMAARIEAGETPDTQRGELEALLDCLVSRDEAASRPGPGRAG